MQQITPYQSFIFKSRYARYLPNEGRREDLPETTGRYLDFMESHLLEKHNYRMPTGVRAKLEGHINGLKNMPSMRAMMTAGKALGRDNTAGFNCSYLPINDPLCFDETMFILLCGTGVGFSVESRYTEQLPIIPAQLKHIDDTILVQDSKEGWGYAFRELLRYLYKGCIPRWDTSLVREAGAILKTFGGRASGPGPLIDLFEYTVHLFQHASGRRLRPLECHDLQCKVGDIVVVGGVRRSAMISLSDLFDTAMARAKSIYEVVSYEWVSDHTYRVVFVDPYNEHSERTIMFNPEKHSWELSMLLKENKVGWWMTDPHRMLSNNSAVYLTRPSREEFDKEWLELKTSGSGERGIFSRTAACLQAAKKGKRSADIEYGTNPCSEIILRPFQMCNLSTNIVRPDDTFGDLLEKVAVATHFGTYQSTLTHFPYLRDIWRQNTEEERLLGVSLTGIMDHPVLNGSKGEDLRDTWLILLNEHAERVNKVLARKLGIEPSTAITCVKPEGTTSQLTDSASGIHSRYAPFYLRSVRQDNKDPVTAFLKDAGVPNEPCVSKPTTTTIFYFPFKSPEGSVTRHDMTAIEQLENWLAYQRYYCDHKPSCTVSVRPEEWDEVADWVYGNFDELSGVSFLPAMDDDHIYQQAPYQDLTEDQYNEWLTKMPKGLDWSQLPSYEREDSTANMQQLACVAGVCEI